MSRILLCIGLLVLLLPACEKKELPEAIVVFAATDAGIADWLEDFTRDSGIPVSLLDGDSRQNAQKVIDNSVFPPADVLISDTIADMWRAADRGALRPLSNAAIGESSPGLRDPDGFWAALLVRPIVIVAASGVDLASIDFDKLASASLESRVCLSSSRLPVNRALLAMLIDERGLKPAERLVRGWIRNLAAAPWPSEDELAAALRGGKCDYGIASGHAALDGLAQTSPEPWFVTTAAVGVARHARQAESAHRFVEWLLRNKQTRGEALGRAVNIAGWLDEDARLLAERAAYH